MSTAPPPPPPDILLGPHVPLQVYPAGGKGLGVFCVDGAAVGEELLRSPVCDVKRHRTARSIQVGWDVHCLFEDPMCLVNHSCDPNCTLRLDWSEPGPLAAVLAARREIAPGEELTWDYAQTESYSIAVGRCLCGSANCRGRSKGFLELSSGERTRVHMELGIADYLE